MFRGFARIQNMHTHVDLRVMLRFGVPQSGRVLYQLYLEAEATEASKSTSEGSRIVDLGQACLYVQQ